MTMPSEWEEKAGNIVDSFGLDYDDIHDRLIWVPEEHGPEAVKAISTELLAAYRRGVSEERKKADTLAEAIHKFLRAADFVPPWKEAGARWGHLTLELNATLTDFYEHRPELRLQIVAANKEIALEAERRVLEECAKILETKGPAFSNLPPHHALQDDSNPDVVRKLYAAAIRKLGEEGV